MTWKLTAKCAGCGYTHQAGNVAPWLDTSGETTTAAGDVSYLCPECWEVTDKEIQILKRPGE